MKGYRMNKKKKDKYYDYYIDNGDDINYNALETNFRKYLKKNGHLDQKS